MVQEALIYRLLSEMNRVQEAKDVLQATAKSYTVYGGAFISQFYMLKQEVL